ncbi:MAG: hypothetical protein FWB85_02565 [Chitinispirillia bacterium]|nr:hypothetical protein [Chitinispirillia bacterium]MCL2241307.1 hypothetical protein [Chitinispirillia bacterium]
MRKIILFIAILTAGVTGQSAADGNAVDRRGRSVQVDGLLLEWKQAGARPWMGTEWKWDAVITPTGIAGALWAGPSPACSAWTFDIIPKAEILATDDENRTTEWLIPDISTDQIRITASSVCGDTLPALVLAVNAPDVRQSSAPAILYMVAIMALAGALTVVIVARRRRKPA